MSPRAGRSSGFNSIADPRVQTLRSLMVSNNPQVRALAKHAAEDLPDCMDQPVQDVLDRLLAERDKHRDEEPELCPFEMQIFVLQELTRKMLKGGPSDINNRTAMDPLPGKSSAARMLHDLNEENMLHEVSALLGLQYLSSAAGPVGWPVRGILYGPCRRPVVCLPTALGKSPTSYHHVFYMVDTTSPYTELSPRAFHAVGVSETPPADAFINLNGQRLVVRLCAQDGHHPDISVLGADALSALRVELRVNYKDEGSVSMVAE